MSSSSCGITTSAVRIDERSKLESPEEVECDKKLCLNCNRNLPFSNFPNHLKSKIEKVSKAVLETVKYLIKAHLGRGLAI